MSDDCDLFSVVRSCCCSSSATSSSTFVSQDIKLVSFPDPRETSKKDEDLQELCKPFLPKVKTISPLSVLDVSPTKKLPQKRQYVMATLPCVTPSTRSKRRKTQKKIVCQIAAEDLSSDTWSWRKYGQKPIKGSPYPRGYYKCSTSKGCLARKQVERNRSDPGMFIVTYTADHNHPMPAHRSSLAGISRLKPDDPTAIEKRKEEEEREGFPVVDEEDDELGGSDMVVGDDFFEGLEEFTG